MSRKSNRQDLKLNHSTGICTLQFKPDITDLGEWMCKFVINTESGWLELGNASLTLLFSRTGRDEKAILTIFIIYGIKYGYGGKKNGFHLLFIVENHTMGWIVGAVTTFVLFIIILAVVLVVFKAKICTRKSSLIFETASNIRQKHARHHNSPHGHSTHSNVLNNPASPSGFHNNVQSNYSQPSRIYENFTTS